MTTITIITIVVVALLTVLIFGLSWLAYSSCIKAYKMEINEGKHDERLRKEYLSKKKKKSKGGLLGLIGSWVVLLGLTSLFVTGIIYRVNGQTFSINNQVSLVIKSGSMSDFYDDEIANQYNNDRSLQFDIGDICIFDKLNNEDELIIGHVYGYKYKDIIITHRLVSVNDELYKFRGDNNRTFDGSVTRDRILYHYTGNKIKGIGSFVLYAQSYFGLWSLVGIVGTFISTEVVYYKLTKIDKDRSKLLSLEPQQLRKIKAQFKRRNGTEVIIYEKENG